MGNGIFLSTVHSVKGMEFDHVFILGENWQNKRGPEFEEERRLYYVAMSRARETLHLLSLQNNKNPHASLLSEKAILHRTMTAEQSEDLAQYRYKILGMRELYIDYASSKAAHHPIHEGLKNLQAGPDRKKPAAIHDDSRDSGHGRIPESGYRTRDS